MGARGLGSASGGALGGPRNGLCGPRAPGHAVQGHVLAHDVALLQSLGAGHPLDVEVGGGHVPEGERGLPPAVLVRQDDHRACPNSEGEAVQEPSKRWRTCVCVCVCVCVTPKTIKSCASCEVRQSYGLSSSAKP